MRANLSILVLALLIICSSTSSLAQFGTPDEAIEAAIRGEEPAYIKDVMAEFSAKMLEWAAKKNIHGRRQRLAYFRTMRLILVFAQGTARDAWKYANPNDAALNAAVEAAFSGRAEPGTHDIHTGFGEYGIYRTTFFFRSAIKAAMKTDKSWREAKGSAISACNAIIDAHGPTDPAKIRYRAAEWWILNYLSDHAEELLDKALSEFSLEFCRLPLRKTDKNAILNIFSTASSWQLFCNDSFGSLNPQIRIFLAPWLNILTNYLLPATWTPANHRFHRRNDRGAITTFLLINNRRYFEGLMRIPLDAVRGVIIPLIIRANLEHRQAIANPMLRPAPPRPDALPVEPLPFKRPRLGDEERVDEMILQDEDDVPMPMDIDDEFPAYLFDAGAPRADDPDFERYQLTRIAFL